MAAAASPSYCADRTASTPFWSALLDRAVTDEHNGPDWVSAVAASRHRSQAHLSASARAMLGENGARVGDSDSRPRLVRTRAHADHAHATIE